MLRAHGATRLRPIHLLVCCGVALGAAAVSHAQTAPSLLSDSEIVDPLDGRPVRDLRVLRTSDEGGEPEPVDPTTDRLVRNQLRSAIGQPYRAEAVREDVTRLDRIGRFSRVETRANLLADGTVVLEFLVTMQPLIVDVQVVGNRKLTDQRIAEVVDLLVGTPADEFQIERAARRIRELYRERGYARAEVDWDRRELERRGIVLFRVQEAERLKVTGIRFEGNDSFSSRRLRSEVSSRVAGILNRGRLDPDTLSDDVAAIIRFYRDRGYLDVRVGREIIEAPNGREAIVTFVVNEGTLYSLRDVRVLYVGSEGEVLSREQIIGVMEIKPGDIYSVGALRRSVRLVRSAFGKLGHTDIALGTDELIDPDRPLVDLELRIDPGPRYRTGEVIIQGNDLTRHDVVRREVEVRPQRPLDSSAIDQTRNQLRGVNLFDRQRQPKVTVQRPDEREPAYRDVLVEVEETNTGNVQFGGQFDSDSGILGRIALTQRNFDIFDTPDSMGELFAGRAFRGGGQTFSIEALPGADLQTYTISLAEPSLFDSKYSGSTAAYYREREFSEHDRQTIGTSLGVGRSFGRRWSGRATVRFESVDLRNIDEDAPVDYFEFEERSILDSVGFSLTRSSLNDPFRPTRGSRARVSVEQFGLMGGDFDFTRLEGRHAFYFPIYADLLERKTVVSFDTLVGYIPQSTGSVPVYERFYLGGRSFRGFEFRTVSPKGIRADTGELGDDPRGGTWQFFWGAQIEQPLFSDQLSVVGFLDTGTVTDDPGFDEYRVSVGTGIRLYFSQLSPAPLAFDFGFPIVKEERDETRLFTFSVDIPF